MNKQKKMEEIKRAQDLLTQANAILWECGEKMGSNMCGSVDDWLTDKYEDENGCHTKACC